MKKSNNQFLANLLFSSFTSVAKNSSSMCPNHIWQEPKVPKCLLVKELEKASK